MKMKLITLSALAAILAVAGLLLWRHFLPSDAQVLKRGQALLKEAPAEGTPEWAAWFEKLSERDQMAWARAADEREKGPEPTEADKGAMHISELPPEKSKVFKATLLENYKPLLQMDKGERSVRNMQIETTRGPNGLESTVWARSGSGALRISWGGKTVAKAKADDTNKDVGGPVSRWDQPGMGLSGGKGTLFIKTNKGFTELPWERPSKVFTLAAAEGYDYIFGSECGDDPNIRSIVVVSISQKKVADIIPVPLTNKGFNCIFDKDQGYLLVVDGTWKWMLMLDLKTEGKPEAQMKRIE